MRADQVCLGVCVAYVACVLGLSLWLGLGGFGESFLDRLGSVAVAIALFGLYGLIVFFPALAAALFTYAALKPRVSRISWWQVTGIICGWTALVFFGISHEIGALGFALIFAAVAGPSFWWGAVGWCWSVEVAPDPKSSI